MQLKSFCIAIWDNIVCAWIDNDVRGGAYLRSCDKLFLFKEFQHVVMAKEINLGKNANF